MNCILAILNVAFELAIGRTKQNQEAMKLNDTHQLMICTDDVDS